MGSHGLARIVNEMRGGGIRCLSPIAAHGRNPIYWVRQVDLTYRGRRTKSITDLHTDRLSLAHPSPSHTALTHPVLTFLILFNLRTHCMQGEGHPLLGKTSKNDIHTS